MKKIFVIIFIISILFQPIVSFAQATAQVNDEQPYMDKSSEKLKRGMVNIVACYGELSKSFGETYENDGFLAAASFGLLKGTLFTVRRAVVGVLETATFFVPSDPILDSPKFFKD
jgi:putative exosortase-associated protein (TIGR04073 family)